MRVEDKKLTKAEEAARMEKLKLGELRAQERVSVDKIRAARKELDMQRKGHNNLKHWHEEIVLHAQVPSESTGTTL